HVHSAAHLRYPPSTPTRRSSDLRLFQKPIEVFQKQRSDRQEREKKRPEGGGGSGQRSEGDSRPHRIAGLKGRGDQKRTRPDENRSEEHTSELQSRENLVCRLLLE